MTHAIDFKYQQQSKLRQFKNFIFIGSNSVDSASNTIEQLHLNPNSSFLSQTKVGSMLAIKEICAYDDTIHQLNALGLRAGKTVKVISKTSKGSVILDLKDSSIGIGTEIAQQIVVTAINETL